MTQAKPEWEEAEFQKMVKAVLEADAIEIDGQVYVAHCQRCGRPVTSHHCEPGWDGNGSEVW